MSPLVYVWQLSSDSSPLSQFPKPFHWTYFGNSYEILYQLRRVMVNEIEVNAGELLSKVFVEHRQELINLDQGLEGSIQSLAWQSSSLAERSPYTKPLSWICAYLACDRFLKEFALNKNEQCVIFVDDLLLGRLFVQHVRELGLDCQLRVAGHGQTPLWIRYAYYRLRHWGRVVKRRLEFIRDLRRTRQILKRLPRKHALGRSVKHADLLLLNLDNYRQIPYFFGYNPVHTVLHDGEIVYERTEHDKPARLKKAASQPS